MKTKTLFIASDDTEFETEEEVQIYEKSLALGKDIEAYIEHAKVAKPMAGMLRKQLPAFLHWMDQRDIEA